MGCSRPSRRRKRTRGRHADLTIWLLWRVFVVAVINPVIYFAGRAWTYTMLRTYTFSIARVSCLLQSGKLASAQRKGAARVHLDSFLAVKKNLQESAAFLALTVTESTPPSETLHRIRAARGSIVPTNTR